jgi:hypothetical protein
LVSNNKRECKKVESSRAGMPVLLKKNESIYERMNILRQMEIQTAYSGSHTAL